MGGDSRIAHKLIDCCVLCGAMGYECSLEHLPHCPRYKPVRYEAGVTFYAPIVGDGANSWASKGVYLTVEEAVDVIMPQVVKDGLTWDAKKLETIERDSIIHHVPIHYIEHLDVGSSLVAYELVGLVRNQSKMEHMLKGIIK